MEYISSQTLNKICAYNCTAMNAFPLSINFSKTKTTNEKNLSATITGQIFEDIFKNIVNKPIDKQLEYSNSYAASLTNIGCSFAHFKSFFTDEYEINLTCNTSIGDSCSITKADSPCSNCSMVNQVCSKKYGGLREDSRKGEKRANEHNFAKKNEMDQHADQIENEEILFLAYDSSLKLKESTFRNSLNKLISNFTKLVSSKENVK